VGIAPVIVLVATFAEIANSASPVPSAAAGATPAPRPIEIDRNSVITLIRTTLVAVQQANQTNNYSVLYGISAPGFQQINSPERLSQIFANLRGKGFDLSGVAVLEPQLSMLPVLYPNGVMRMAGFFPSVPMQVYFDLQFIGVQGQWRLLGIAVDVGPPGAIAPSTEAPRPGPAQSSEQKAAPVTEAPRSAPTQSSTPRAAPSVDVGRPRPTPTSSPGP
jgi:hypothetical protein